MSNYATLKAAIQEVVTTNGNNEITGALLQQTLIAIVNSLGADYQFAGVALPNTNPGTPDQNVVYIAGKPGTYNNFNGYTVAENEIVIFSYNGAWSQYIVWNYDGLNISKIYGKNLFNRSAAQKGYIDSRNGNFIAVSHSSNSPYATDFIPIDSRGVYVGNGSTYGTYGGYAVYDAGKQFIRGGRGEHPAIEYQDGDAYIRATVDVGSGYSQQINAGLSLDTPVVPYEEPKISISTPGFEIQATQIPNLSIENIKIKNGTIGIEKLANTVTVRSKNLLDVTKIVTSRWINSTGGVSNVTSSYGYFPYIEVEPETAYHISNRAGNALSTRTDAYIAFYNESKTFISSVASNTKNITTPANCRYVRISVEMSRITDAQMELGTVRTAYEQYFEPRTCINPDNIIFPNNGVTTEKIADGAITQSKIADGVSLPARPNTFRGFRVNGTLAPAESLLTPRVYITKDTRIVANISGVIQNVEVGISRNGTYGRWVVITPTQLIIKYGTSGTTANEYSHGLTLGTKTKLIITKTMSYSSINSATIKLIDDYGNIFSQTVTWATYVGSAFVYNANTTGSIDAELTFIPADITKQIWIFGDSYLSFDTARWIYYPITWGFLSYLVNARGGENATEAFADLQTLLTLGAVPSFIVWCMGMNNGTDSGGNVNATWLGIMQQVQTICTQYGITLIMATIPTVPGASHVALNNWVRSSGYRYIDFAAAVEDPNTTYWRGWGTDNALLSNDEVHPTTHGAVELAMRALLDFPEMMVKEN